MDEPLVLISKLDEFALLANTEDVFEKGVIFSVATSILGKFEESKLHNDSELLDMLKAVCYFINAAIGYESIQNKTQKQCIESAQAKLDKARNLINQKYL